MSKRVLYENNYSQKGKKGTFLLSFNWLIELQRERVEDGVQRLTKGTNGVFMTLRGRQSGSDVTSVDVAICYNISEKDNTSSNCINNRSIDSSNINNVNKTTGTFEDPKLLLRLSPVVEILLSTTVIRKSNIF